MVYFGSWEGERRSLMGAIGIIILAHSMESRENSAINLHLPLLQESSKHFKIQRDPCGGRVEGQVYIMELKDLGT